MRRLLLFGLALLAACGGGSEATDTGARSDSGRGTSGGDGSLPLDAGLPLDAAPRDAVAIADARTSSDAAAAPDTGPSDTGPAGDGSRDASGDAGLVDSGALDTGVVVDTGVLPDGGVLPDVGPSDGGPQAGGLVITEILVRTSTIEWIELENTSAQPIDLNQYGLRIRSHAQLGRLAIAAMAPLAPGARAAGVPNPPAPAQVPAFATFVFGAAGALGGNAFFDGGDVVDVEGAAGLADRLDFTNAAVDPAQPVGPNAFPLLPGVPMELDATAPLELANDDGARWCANLFRRAGTPGAPNTGCRDLVINEVLNDASTERAGRMFVELAGPAGAPLGGLVLGQATGTGANVPVVEVPLLAARVPLDGFFVVAGDAGGGTTRVANPDQIAALALAAGPGGVQLVRSAGPQLLDAVGWGVAMGSTGGTGALPIVEGAPLADIRAGDYPTDWARRADHADTNGNASDFRYDPSPTPGAPNGAAMFALTSITPDDAIATRTATVVIRGTDFTDRMAVSIGSVSPSRCAYEAPDALRCVVTDPTPGPRRVSVAASTRAEQGLSAMLANGFSWTISANETDTAAEVDYANIQFPATETIAAGGTTQLIFGRIYERGLTDSTSGQVASIAAELGYGPPGSDPTVSNAWTWVPAMFNREYGNNDEYMARLSVPTSGTYLYTLRFSLDGGLTWTYADLNGAGSNAGLSFDAAMLGTLTVNP